MKIQIKDPVESECLDILKLMSKFAEFEGLSEFFDVTERILRETIFGKDKFVESLVAVSEDRVVGYSLFFPYFSSFRGKLGYYLEDIYVDPEFRGNGVGKAMLKKIAHRGKLRGFDRIDFQVLAWNEPAIRFYEGLGATRDEAERRFKFTDDAFSRLTE